MKKLIFLIFLAFIIQISFAQVGIGTTSPTAQLDVNGDIRVRSTIPEIEESIVQSSILVASTDGIIKRTTSKMVFESNNKTLVKANLSNTSTLGISLSNNSSEILSYNNEVTDLNDEYNASTFEFSPKQSGFYEVYAMINMTPKALVISTSTNVGLQIKKGTTVIAENSAALVGATFGLINVYVQPIRVIHTVIELTPLDVVTFHINNGGLLNINIDLLSEHNGYFFIRQVR